ncbi:MAG TPA: TonB family protein, partial [Pyrinomonadaceae bacterium]|nr:TonB family protein [Pyrinomonadaceae bacterium]
MKLFSPLFVFCMMVSANAQLPSQNANDEKCPGKIYGGKEVSRRAKLLDFPFPIFPKEALAHDVHGTVIISAVLCRDGRVTDIEVVKGLPFGVTESALNAVRNRRFVPAELDLHSVSQRMQFQFGFNETESLGALDPAAAAGRLVEEIDIVGNRRMTKEEVLSSIKSRPGDPYSATQVEADLQALLNTGYFNKSGTRVGIESAPRGGVRVTFEVFELPLVTEITFDRSGRLDQTALINELARQHVNLRVGGPCDPVELTKATSAIEGYLRSQGWINAKAQAFVNSSMITEV